MTWSGRQDRQNKGWNSKRPLGGHPARPGGAPRVWRLEPGPAGLEAQFRVGSGSSFGCNSAPLQQTQLQSHLLVGEGYCSEALQMLPVPPAATQPSAAFPASSGSATRPLPLGPHNAATCSIIHLPFFLPAVPLMLMEISLKKKLPITTLNGKSESLL